MEEVKEEGDNKEGNQDKEEDNQDGEEEAEEEEDAKEEVQEGIQEEPAKRRSPSANKVGSIFPLFLSYIIFYY